MDQSLAYVLNRRPFRDSSLLLELFTETHGRICCVARPAKKRGKVLKGTTEPFRYLAIQWIGKGDVQTLTEADERGRHDIPGSQMMLGLYINELILALTRQHIPQPELFSAYKYTLHKIGDPLVNREILMRFEVYLLASLGYELKLEASANPHEFYYFHADQGLLSIDQYMEKSNPIKISRELLEALSDLTTMDDQHWSELRKFLDQAIAQLATRPINSRRMLQI